MWEKLAEVHGGYSQSKWVAEKLLALAAARGVPLSVYRPARITGHSVSGACNTDDFLFRMLKGCVQLGAYPAFNWLERAAPIDFVAAATVAISMRPHCARHLAFHLVHTEAFAWADLFEWTRQLGYQLQRTPLKEWVGKLEAERDAAVQPEQPNSMVRLAAPEPTPRPCCGRRASRRRAQPSHCALRGCLAAAAPAAPQGGGARRGRPALHVGPHDAGARRHWSALRSNGPRAMVALHGVAAGRRILAEAGRIEICREVAWC